MQDNNVRTSYTTPHELRYHYNRESLRDYVPTWRKLVAKQTGPFFVYDFSHFVSEIKTNERGKREGEHVCVIR